MSLPVLVGVVAFGIALVVFLVHVTGGSTRLVMADGAQAEALFLADHEDAQVRRVMLTDNGQEAVLLLADGGIGFVHSMGSKAVALRFKAGAGPVAKPASDGPSVIIAFHDMSMPDLTLTFADARDRDSVAAALSGGAAPDLLTELEAA